MKKVIFLLFFVSFLSGAERIVALAPSINEIIFALGRGDNIVGNTTHAVYPKKSQEITKVGGYFSISLEKILSLKPTLVLMQKNNLSLKPKLEKLGLKTKLITVSSLKDIKNSIIQIGTLIDSKKEAENIISDIDKALKTTKGILNDKKILIVFGRYFDLKKEIFISGNSVYFADIIKASGNQNAFKELSSNQPMLSYEGIVALNPDIIYILAHQSDKTEIKKLIAPWLELPINAAKSKTIFVTTKKYASMPSHRVVRYIEDFAEVLKDAKSKFTLVQY